MHEVFVSQRVPEAVMRKVGNAIRLARAHKDMSQSVVAERAGITPGYLSQIENGRALPVSRLRAIADALDLRVTEVLDFVQRDSSDSLFEIVYRIFAMNEELEAELLALGPDEPESTPPSSPQAGPSSGRAKRLRYRSRLKDGARTKVR